MVMAVVESLSGSSVLNKKYQLFSQLFTLNKKYQLFSFLCLCMYTHVRMAEYIFQY